MGKLVSTLFVTLDGVYQAPGGPQEDTRGGFTHGGWSFPYADEDFGRFMGEVFTRPGAFLLGRRTYDIFATYWPKVTDPADPAAAASRDRSTSAISPCPLLCSSKALRRQMIAAPSASESAPATQAAATSPMRGPTTATGFTPHAFHTAASAT